MRHPARKIFGVVMLFALLGVQCAAPRGRVPSVVKPAEVEVRGADPLIVMVTGMQKRPLRPEELVPPTTGGFLWEYRVLIANPTATPVTFDHLRMTVQNLWGDTWPGDQPLNLRITGGDEAEIPVEARMASSNPRVEPGVTGLEILTFLGEHDGQPISITIRVPLD